MRGRRAAWIAFPVLVVMLALIVVLATTEDSDPASPLLGRQAPPIAGRTIAGDDFELTGAPGQYVVVNFFATWCVPCIREHPELVDFERRHRAEGDAAVVSVVYDADPDAVAEFFADNGGDWPVVEDPDGRVALSYGVSGVPESYLVAPDGVVVAALKGGVTAGELDQLLAEAEAVR